MVMFHIQFEGQDRVGCELSLYDWGKSARDCADWMRRGHSYAEQTEQARDAFRTPISGHDGLSLQAAMQFALGIAWRNGRSLKNMSREEASEVCISFTDAKNPLNPHIPLVNMQFKRASAPTFFSPSERIIPIDGAPRKRR